MQSFFTFMVYILISNSEEYGFKYCHGNATHPLSAFPEFPSAHRAIYFTCSLISISQHSFSAGFVRPDDVDTHRYNGMWDKATNIRLLFQKSFHPQSLHIGRAHATYKVSLWYRTLPTYVYLQLDFLKSNPIPNRFSVVVETIVYR